MRNEDALKGWTTNEEAAELRHGITAHHLFLKPPPWASKVRRAVPLDPLISAIPRSSREAPWHAGLLAARANLLPGLIVQGLILAVLLGYYFSPQMRIWLTALADLKARWGYGYAAINAVLAGAIIPELLRVFLAQKGRLLPGNSANLRFSIPFWALTGMSVDFFYRCQADWFGTEATFSVVVKKVLVDQFLYNPLFAAPVTAWLYDWKNLGYPRHGLGGFFTFGYYRDAVVPTLFAAWGVWIPVVTILYSLPSALQIPLFGLALSLWVVLYNWLSEQRTRR